MRRDRRPAAAPPGPRGRGRAGSSGWIRSQSRSSMTCCNCGATTEKDHRLGHQITYRHAQAAANQLAPMFAGGVSDYFMAAI